LRIEFRVDGGLAAFPGLAQPVTIHCDALPPQARAHLRELVRRADFFGSPERDPQPPTPDARGYTIAIDDAGQCKTVTVHEPIADPALRDLVAELRQQARAARRTK
jgi:hypothetical protein